MGPTAPQINPQLLWEQLGLWTEVQDSRNEKNSLLTCLYDLKELKSAVFSV